MRGSLPDVFVTANTPLIYEGISGRLIPCRFVPNWGTSDELESGWAWVRITKTCHGYKLGEIVKVGRRYLIPRKCLRRRKHSTVIVGTWRFQEPTHSL